MYYHDQLVPTGELSSTGYTIMTNVPRSYRLGIELTAGLKPFSFLDWNFTVTLSRNKITDFISYYTDYDTVTWEGTYKSRDFDSALLDFQGVEHVELAEQFREVGRHEVNDARGQSLVGRQAGALADGGLGPVDVATAQFGEPASRGDDRQQERERLSKLLSAEGDLETLRWRLVNGLRDGSIALDHPGLAEHLRTTVVNQIAIDQQGGFWHWNIFRLENGHFLTMWISFIIFFICSVAETNRAPFDLGFYRQLARDGYDVVYGSAGSILVINELAALP